MTSKTTTVRTLTSVPGDLTAGDLYEFLDGVPADAAVTIRTDYPDRPGERGSVTLSVTGASDAAATVWPECDNHREVQHRDGQSPWCNTCGWNRGRGSVPPMQIAPGR